MTNELLTNTEIYDHKDDQGQSIIADGSTRVRRIGESRNGRWNGQVNPQHVQRAAAAAEFFADLLEGHAPAWALREALVPSWPGQTDLVIRNNYPELYRRGAREAISTSDLPYLMGEVLDRMLLANYRQSTHNWRAYIGTRRPLNDFRNVQALYLNGGSAQYEQVTEQQPLQYGSVSEGRYQYSPNLYAMGAKLTWRAIMNDDLQALETIPERLGNGGRRTIEKFATQLLFGATGPDTTLFSSGNGNRLSSNPVFSITSLGTAFETLLGLQDSDGNPIVIEAATLIVGPGLYVEANNLLNQLTVDISTSEGASTRVVRTNNWIVRNLTLVQNPWIPIVATTNGATSWVLASNPATGRPIAQMGFLRGFEEPQLYQKLATTRRVGGGEIDQAMGDFETMEQHYKGVMAFGGLAMDPKAAVASNGSGS